MSQTMATAKAPLWKPSTRGNNLEFLASFKRLQQEDVNIYNLIGQREGFIGQDNQYEYKVGRSQYGLWCSRRRLGLGNTELGTISSASPYWRNSGSGPGVSTNSSTTCGCNQTSDPSHAGQFQ